MNLPYRILYMREKKRTRKLRERLGAEMEKRRISQNTAHTLRRNLSRTLREKDELEEGYVIQVCPNCSEPVQMIWSIKQDGMAAFCPFCGQRLLLCSYCQDHQCDYDPLTDSCKKARKMLP